jgi:hypothetical protein
MAPMRSYPEITATAADGQVCVAFAGETEGPFRADGRGRSTVISVLGGAALQRSDIRTSFGDRGRRHFKSRAPAKLIAPLAVLA